MNNNIIIIYTTYLLHIINNITITLLLLYTHSGDAGHVAEYIIDTYNIGDKLPFELAFGDKIPFELAFGITR